MPNSGGVYGAIYKVGPDGKAPKGLKPGDQVVTEAGTYTITGTNANGGYTSQLTNPNQTTSNYTGIYASTPSSSGGIPGTYDISTGNNYTYSK